MIQADTENVCLINNDRHASICMASGSDKGIDGELFGMSFQKVILWYFVGSVT